MRLQFAPASRSFLSRGLLVLTGLAATLALPAASWAAKPSLDQRKKVALVIGISVYDHATDLRNPQNDAREIAARLNYIGFAVTTVLNATKDDADARIAGFTRAAEDADVALIYYSGHGLQMAGENYIVPKDFSPAGGDVRNQLLSVTEILASLPRTVKARIIFLDACRDNPFLEAVTKRLATSQLARGLAPIRLPASDVVTAATSAQPHGFIVGYATQPNEVASDGAGRLSPYASALLQATVYADEDLQSILVKMARRVYAETGGEQHPEHRVALTKPLFLQLRPEPLMCDVLAAEQDNNISLPGVEFDDIDVEKALPACRSDAERNPRNPRILHNLARVLDKAGKDAEAVRYYKQSAKLGFDWAQNNLAMMYMNAEGVERDVKSALSWLRQAFNQGNRQAVVNYTGVDLTPMFRKAPRRTRGLQRHLRLAGYPDLAETGRLDPPTVSALVDYKAREKLRGDGVTLQIVDRLNAAEAVFRSEKGY